MLDTRAFSFYHQLVDELELLNESELGVGKNKRQFEIIVAKNEVRDEWTVACGLIKRTAPSVSEALHELANLFDGIGAYGSDKAQTDTYARKHSKPCMYCEAPIFFGQLQSGKWLALDAEPIMASLAVGARLATFIDYNGQHMVRFPSKPQGRVWIPHPTVCGTNSNEPLQPALKKRWQARRDSATERAAEQKAQAITQLLTIADDLTGEQHTDDSHRNAA